jgi:hypothetical protein
MIIDRTDPNHVAPEDLDLLMECLIAARSLREELALEIEALVAEARLRGATWHQVGIGLECSPQAAQKKFKSGLSPEGRARLEAIIENEILDAEWQLRYSHSPVQLADGVTLPALSDEETDRLMAFLEDQEALDEAVDHQRVPRPPTPKVQR